MKYGKKLCETKEENESAEYVFPAEDLVSDLTIRARRIFLVGEIDEIVSLHVCNYLQLYALSKDPVFIYINSTGGCLYAGYAIIDQMLLSPFPINIVIRGQAFSMAAIIAAFGTKGHRYITPNSSVMLHSIIIQNSLEPIEKANLAFDHLQLTYQQKLNHLSKRIGIPKKKLLEMLKDSSWLTPQQAIQIGIVDEIWTPKKEAEVNKRIKS